MVSKDLWKEVDLKNEDNRRSQSIRCLMSWYGHIHRGHPRYCCCRVQDYVAVKLWFSLQ